MEVPKIVLTFNSLITIFYLAVPGTVIAIYLMNRFQCETTPIKAVIIYALEPVFAILLGFIILKETVGWLELMGGGLIIAGILVSELWEYMRRTTKDRR